MSSASFTAYAPPPGPPDPRFASAGLACGSADVARERTIALARRFGETPGEEDAVNEAAAGWWGFPSFGFEFAVIRRLNLCVGPPFLRVGVSACYLRSAAQDPGGLARAALDLMTAEPSRENDGVTLYVTARDGRTWDLARAPVCRTETGQADRGEFTFRSGWERDPRRLYRRRPPIERPERGLPAELTACWRGGGPAEIRVHRGHRERPDGVLSPEPDFVPAADPAGVDAALQADPYERLEFADDWESLAPHAVPALRRVAARPDLARVSVTVRLRVDRADGAFDARLANLAPTFGRPFRTETTCPQRSSQYGGFWAFGGTSLRDGVDPFVRPPGRPAVRFGLFGTGRLRLDILHRAAGRAGGPVLDLQMFDRRGRAAARLARVLACLDRRTFPFEPWAGDPWGRWE